MSRMDNVRRLVSEDFKKEDQDTVGKIGLVVNRFMDQVVNIVNGNVEFDNLSNFSTLSFKITVDSDGIPIGNDIVRSELIGTKGLMVISANNKTDTGLTGHPSATPFMSTTTGANSNVIKITHISGVNADEEYEYTVIAIS